MHIDDHFDETSRLPQLPRFATVGHLSQAELERLAVFSRFRLAHSNVTQFSIREHGIGNNAAACTVAVTEELGYENHRAQYG
jgi:hypothetical protein